MKFFSITAYSSSNRIKGSAYSADLYIKIAGGRITLRQQSNGQTGHLTLKEVWTMHTYVYTQESSNINIRIAINMHKTANYHEMITFNKDFIVKPASDFSSSLFSFFTEVCYRAHSNIIAKHYFLKKTIRLIINLTIPQKNIFNFVEIYWNK